MATRARIVALAAVLPLVAACYTYAPAQAPMPGAPVRAALTVEGAVRQSEMWGEPVRNFTGRLVSLDSEFLQIDVITASTRGQLNEIILRDTLRIPMREVEQVEERRISWLRTGIVGGGMAVVVGSILNSLSGGGGDVEGGGDLPPVADRITIPIFQIRR